MCVLKLRTIIIFALIISFVLVAYFMGFKGTFEASSKRTINNKIVIDAGHGLPDGGATANGITESTINLRIAKILKEKLEDLGYEIIMTREDENALASGASFKRDDLNLRTKIINESGAAFCVSIHLNKFTDSKYYGWQCFFSESSTDGKKLAELIQNGIKETIQIQNKRVPLKINGIKIVDKTTIPVVIVECGFISNLNEARLLLDDTYREKIALGIVKGIEDFYKN